MENEEKFRMIAYKAYEKRISDVWKILEDEKLEIILIKGWAAAQNYPKPYVRDIGDIDIAVNPEQYQSIFDLSKVYPIAAVDFHKGLRHLDLSEWKTLYDNSRSLNCGAIKIKIPSFEDNLRILIVHWLNDGGINEKKLWDIYYAVDNRPADFDWDYFLNSNGQKRRKWLICGIGLAHKYLDLNLEGTPIEKEAKNIPNWVIKTVEHEWKTDVRYGYLDANLSDSRQFFQQLKKRFPPNPIQATVEMEGNFDDGTRIFYQISDVCKRLPSSVSRVSRALFYKLKNN